MHTLFIQNFFFFFFFFCWRHKKTVGYQPRKTQCLNSWNGIMLTRDPFPESHLGLGSVHLTLKGHCVVLEKKFKIKVLIFMILMRQEYNLRNTYFLHNWINKQYRYNTERINISEFVSLHHCYCKYWNSDYKFLLQNYIVPLWRKSLSFFIICLYPSQCYRCSCALQES